MPFFYFDQYHRCSVVDPDLTKNPHAAYLHRVDTGEVEYNKQDEAKALDEYFFLAAEAEWEGN